MSSPVTDEWYYHSRGKDYGPVKWAVIESMLQNDRLALDDLVMRAGTTVRVRIEDVIRRMRAARPAGGSPSSSAGPGRPDHRLQAVPPGARPVPPAPVRPLPQPTTVGPDDNDVEDEDGEPQEIEDLPESRGSAPQPRIVLRAAADLALNAQRLLFAAQLGAVWCVMTAALLFAGLQLGPLFPIAIFLVICLAIACQNVLAGGISHMVAVELQGAACPSWRQAWDFVIRRAIPLILGPLIVGVIALVGLGIVAGLFRGITMIPTAGPILGGVLFIPAFLFVICGLSLAINAYLIPVIIGVEDCGLTDAVIIWRSISTKQPFQLFVSYIRAIFGIAPTLLLSLIVTAIGLVGAIGLTVDLGGLANQEMDASFGVYLHLLSVLLIAATWVSFALVFITTSFTTVYHNASGG